MLKLNQRRLGFDFSNNVAKTCLYGLKIPRNTNINYLFHFSLFSCIWLLTHIMQAPLIINKNPTEILQNMSNLVQSQQDSWQWLERCYQLWVTDEGPTTFIQCSLCQFNLQVTKSIVTRLVSKALLCLIVFDPGTIQV